MSKDNNAELSRVRRLFRQPMFHIWFQEDVAPMRPLDIDLLDAADRNDLEGVKKAIKAGADKNARVATHDHLAMENKWTALHFAVEKGYLDMADYLVNESKAFVFGEHLLLALKNGHLEITEILTGEENRNVDILLLDIASKYPAPSDQVIRNTEPRISINASAIKFLLSKGANPNFQYGQFNTPMQYLADRADLATVRLVIKHGGDFLQENEKRQTSYQFLYQNHGADAANEMLELFHAKQNALKINAINNGSLVINKDGALIANPQEKNRSSYAMGDFSVLPTDIIEKIFDYVIPGFMQNEFMRKAFASSAEIIGERPAVKIEHIQKNLGEHTAERFQKSTQHPGAMRSIERFADRKAAKGFIANTGLAEKQGIEYTIKHSRNKESEKLPYSVVVRRSSQQDMAMVRK